MYKKTPKFASILSLTTIMLLMALALSSSSLPVKAAGAPILTLIPPAGPVGIPITVIGTGFTPGTAVTLTWFGNIVDVPGIAGHLSTYTIKSGITADANGNFTTSIISPSDFSDIPHLVNATQNGIGTGITNATFTTVPTMILSPQPANYAIGQQVFLNITGGPLGSAALPFLAPGSSASVLKFTYDNGMWGFDTSHLTTEGPVSTGGFIGWDVGGNLSIRFTATGGVGTHSIRAYVGEKDTPIWLSCEIGGTANFNITGPNSDTQTILNNLASLNSNIVSVQGNTATIVTSLGTVTTYLNSIGATVGGIQGDTASIKTTLGTVTASLSDIDAKLVSVQGDTATLTTSLGAVNASLNDINAKIVSIQGDTATIKTSQVGDTATIETTLGTINGTVTSTSNDVATIKTSIGTLTLDNVKASADNAVNYSLVAVVLSVIGLVILLAIATQVFRKR